MKILVIPDVHGRQFWRDAVKENIENVDKIVFLGDYLDPYDDEDEKVEFEDAIKGLEEIIDLKKNNSDKIILLLGNHDMHYLNGLYCDLAKSTRYRSYYAKTISKILNDNLDLFNICYTAVIGDKKVIFTHAGITKHWADKCGIAFDDEIEENVNKLLHDDDGIRKLAIIGEYRTWFGGDKTGSPLWCDIREFDKNDNKEFDNDCIQIFGHTRLNPGRMAHYKNYYCVDSQRAYILDDELKLEQI